MNAYTYPHPMLGALMGQLPPMGPMKAGAPFELSARLAVPGYWVDNSSDTIEVVRNAVLATDLVDPNYLQISFLGVTSQSTADIAIAGYAKWGHDSATHLKDTLLWALRSIHPYSVDDASVQFWAETYTPQSQQPTAQTPTQTPGAAPTTPTPPAPPKKDTGLSPLMWLGLAAIAVIAISRD